MKDPHDISKVKLAVGRVDLDVVQRVELAAVEVIQQDCKIMWWLWVHEDDVGRPCASSGIDEDQVSFIGSSSSVRHLHCLRKIDLITGSSIRIKADSSSTINMNSTHLRHTDLDRTSIFLSQEF